MEEEDKKYAALEPTYTRILFNNDKPDQAMIEKTVKRIDPSIQLNDYSKPVDVFNKLIEMGYAKTIAPNDNIVAIGEIINSLFNKVGINIRINGADFTKMDNDIIKRRRMANKTTKTYDLNVIDHYLYNVGYEIIEIYIYNLQSQVVMAPCLIMTKREQ
jgi:hypothetical protein